MLKIAHIFYFPPVIALTAIAVLIVGCERKGKAIEEELKATFRRVIEEAWNRGNLDAFDELYSINFVRHRPPFPDIQGLEAHKQRFEIVLNVYPDHKAILHDIITDGDKVAVRYTWNGTHTGQGLSIPPSGKQVTVTGCDVYKMVDGKIVEEWDHEGFLSLFQQLGYKLVPPEDMGEK